VQLGAYRAAPPLAANSKMPTEIRYARLMTSISLNESASDAIEFGT